MFENYLKTALRNLLQKKIFSLINISGFAIGICAVVFILHYVQFNLSYDDYHQNADRIFRVSVVSQIKGSDDFDSPVFTPPIGPAMLKDFPEIENYTRYRTARPENLIYNNNTYKIEDVAFAENTFFNLFSVEFISGNPSSCLSAPNQIALSKSTAGKIFGSENPIGKIISAENNENYTVTGVYEDAPKNSELRFNGIASFKTLYKNVNGNAMGWNGGHQYMTYVLLKKDSYKKSVEEKFPSFMWSNINKYFEGIGVKYSAYLQPLKDIHTEYSENAKGLKTNIMIFSIIALFIILLACINFINLFMARSIKRNKEIGIRKVLGAHRKDILYQFITESSLLIVVSAAVAVFLSAAALPVYNRFTGQEFTFLNLLNIKLIISALLAVGLLCLSAGFYPSFVLSSFQPAQIIKKPLFNRPGKITLKGALVVFQFAISIALIICTLLINNQLDYIKEKELGFDKENQICISLSGRRMKAEYGSMKAEMLKIKGVVNAAVSSGIPVNGFTSNGYSPEGFQNPIMINVVDAEPDFLKTYNIPLITGRNFFPESLADKDAYLVNEAFARKMNWKDPVGKEIERNGIHTIIGVVKDFNFASLHDRIAPLIITCNPEMGEYDYMTVKIKSPELISVISSIRNVYNSFSDGMPMDYTFIDESLQKVYEQESIFREIFTCFAFIAVVIALLGILGLTLFAVERKKKEIAIRKALGAKIAGITLLISKQFSLWIILANIIAWPAAYYFIKKWLADYAYTAEISFLSFILAAAGVFVISLIIICFYIIRAAINNPVESLKYE